MIKNTLNRANFLCIVIIIAYNSVCAQSKHSTGSVTDNSLKENLNTVLIVEPVLKRNVLPIKSIILNTIKQEMNGIYNYKILSLDSVSDFIDGKYTIRFDDIISNNEDFKYILFAEHYFIQMNTEIITGYVDINYESRITLSLFDKYGTLICRSIKDSSRLPLGTRNNPLKILERATERAITEILEKALILDK